MSAVFFNPWKGDHYASSPVFGKKILVLGESHYQWDNNKPLVPESTRDFIIKGEIEGRWRKQFWTNIAVAFLNKRPTPEEKKDFWHSVSFYNYIQEIVGSGPRVRPSEKMWKTSEPGFIEVLDLLTPNALIVLGYELWKNLPCLNRKPGPTICGAKQPKTWYYPLTGGGSCLAYGIRHPSAGFSGKYWHPYVKQVIALAQPRRYKGLTGGTRRNRFPN